MKKELKSLLMAASLVSAAALVFVACGSGEADLFDIGTKFKQDTDGARIELVTKIDDDGSEVWYSYNAEPDPSSSSIELPPSSMAPGLSSSVYVPPGSSGITPPMSSSFQIILPSSSSAEPPKSSSSKAPNVSGCKENNPRAGFNCAWDGTGVLVPGKIIKPAAYTLPSGCTSVMWKFAADTSGMVLNYECEALPEAGVSAGGSKNYVLFAELTCESGAKQTTACSPKTGWSSKVAPTLSGKCAWEKNPTTTARGGSVVKDDQTIKVVDKDGVCKSPSVVYKYDGGTKTWPTSGILSEWKTDPIWKDKKHEETYEVKATLDCPEYPEAVTSSCPALKVTAGADQLVECPCKGDGQCQLANVCKTTVITLKADECVEISVEGYDNQYHYPTVGMRCQSGNATYTYTVNGGAAKAGGHEFILLKKVALGDNDIGTFCIASVSGGTSITCNLSFE